MSTTDTKLANANSVSPQNATQRTIKPLPTNHHVASPPVPVAAPPLPPSHSAHAQQQQQLSNRNPPGHNHTNVHHTHVHGHTNGTRGRKQKVETSVDPVQMYESLKNRIAALEEEEVLEEEEERQFAEEAHKSVKGMEENAIHAKYIELFAELKRLERDHAKEKQKLAKDKDTAKSQLTKANQVKTKMENLARELQKDNKRLREDGKRLAQSVEDAQEELAQMKSDISKRVDKAKLQELKYRDTPDIVVKVVCRYRAELFFKISRKTKLSRLFNAWTDRMENSTSSVGGGVLGKKVDDGKGGKAGAKVDAVSTTAKEHAGREVSQPLEFIFTHNGRAVEADQTPEEAGMEDNDEILAVELMDLTDSAGTEDWDVLAEPRRQKLQKEWNNDPIEAKRTLEDIFDGVVRERLKEVLRQYELRERHFECVVRSKELEVLLSRARAAEQKQLAEGEKIRCEKHEEENQRLRKEMDKLQQGQAKLVEKLIACCNEPNAEKTRRLFTSLQEELDKRGHTTKLRDDSTPPEPAEGG